MLRLSDKLRTQLTTGPTVDVDPAAINAHEFLFASMRSGILGVWGGSIDGSPPRQLTSGPFDMGPDAARNEDWFVFLRFPTEGTVSFQKVPVVGGAATKLPHESIFGYAALSPDGKLLAYIAQIDDQQFELRVVPLEGGEAVLRFGWTADSRRSRWSADGSEISFLVTKKFRP